MTKEYGSIDVDFYLEHDEMNVSIRKNDGSKLTYQQAFDGFMCALEEAYGVIAAPITKEEIRDNKSLN